MKKNYCGLLLAGFVALQAACGVLAEEIDFSHVAGSASMAKVKSVSTYGMLPIYGRDVADGTYEIKVKSSSSKFHIEKAVLTVADGRMEADLTLSGKGYLCLYMGTGEEAAGAAREDYIDFADQDGWYTYHVPVEALDAEVSCAAFSKRKEQWYDRTLLFDASSLPAEALRVELPDYERIAKALEAYEAGNETEETASEESEEEQPAEALAPVSTELADGDYSIEVNLTGGSGKATVSSPTLMHVEDGKMYAELTWSSSNYDYLLLRSERYDNENTEGGYSHFTIPVTALDQAIPIVADTTAMGGQTEIDYTLEFFEASIGSKDQIPQEAAKKVVAVAFVIIVGGGILNAIVKKRRRA